MMRLLLALAVVLAPLCMVGGGALVYRAAHKPAIVAIETVPVLVHLPVAARAERPAPRHTAGASRPVIPDNSGRAPHGIRHPGDDSANELNRRQLGATE